MVSVPLKWRQADMLERCRSLSFMLRVCVLVALTQTACTKAVAQAESRDAQEPVEGHACYTYADGETPAEGKQAAISLARESAVRSHRVFVQSAHDVRALQLEEDVVQAASATLLERVRVEKEETRGQEICVTVTAAMSPVSMKEMIRQRVSAKELSQAAVSVVPRTLISGTKVWTNKLDGHYVEGDQLIIYVQSDRDSYLKLDYFQADGTVVHLVPNMFHEQEVLKAGHVYEFGADASAEKFTIQGPFGSETVKAILSAQPFNKAVNGINVIGDSREYLQVLAGTRGVKVEGRPNSDSASLNSDSVSLNTMSKEEARYKKGRLVVPR